MIYGIGIDIVKIDRIRDAASRWGQRFLGRIFTEDEISHAFHKKEPYLSLAVRFAAKEALVKAIGGAIHVPLKNIEILNAANGQPFIRVSGDLESFFRKNAIMNTHLSLSHEREFGVACVVLERR